ncbi:F-box SNE-like [Chlorella sorokiniana]|uniref:F-box SNE-like n=1 Tax=Chlorella sorokiniana TaxID=3076 RepID=A0A2P6TJK5_CHLSO|nr:F-box SNE-like [Chlorella sorokiniana]|eukprot:PRW44266.1 F-box SNE-like [Chlorella sorokiniana]
MDLDASSLHFLFSTYLDGPDIAACAQVCRAWRSVAASEVLWASKVAALEPHPHLRRDDLLPAFGDSHRAYYAWRWPLLRRPLRRILVESDVPDLEIATFPAPETLASGGSGYEASIAVGANSSGGAGPSGASGEGPDSMEGVETAAEQCGQQQQRQQQQQRGAVGVAWEHNVVQQATLSPAGALLAFTELAATRMGALESWVVIADARTGRRVCSVALADPHPPFYYFWLSCGTRLMFLSNWAGDVVALRAVDLAPALIPLSQPSPAGTAGPSAAQQAQQARQAGQEVLLCTARPLFLAASPTSTRLLWHGNSLEWGMCDAATQVSEDGAEHDCFFANARDCRCQAPQWVLNAAGEELLLMPVLHPDPPAGAADDSGILVLASLESVSHAYEAEGSRLSPSLLLILSREVAPFSSARELSFAANGDASLIAWVDCGRLWVKWQHTGAVHPIWPRPAEEHAMLQQQRAAAQEVVSGGSARSGGGGGSNGPPIESAPWVDRGAVLAMQWSPDGRRLLFLLHAGPSPLVALSKRPRFRWVVYDAPAAPLPPIADAGAPAGWLGSLTACCPFNPSLQFLDRYLPFADQYLRSLQLWDPDSCAFCFASRGRPSVGEVSEEPNVSVQHVPRPNDAPSSSGGGSTSGGGGIASGEVPPLRIVDAAPPVWLAPGHMASWSWQ